MANSGNKPPISQKVLLALGAILVAVGMFGLVGAVVPGWVWPNFVNMARAAWRFLWPLALVAAGAYLLWAVKSGKLGRLSAASPNRSFRRSRADARILGVCGGIAYYFGIDSTIVRVMAVILLVAWPPSAIVAYLLIGLVVPRA